jgi:hypothetical protein
LRRKYVGFILCQEFFIYLSDAAKNMTLKLYDI